MADFTSEAKGTDFSNESAQPQPLPSIYERIGQLYKSVADPLRNRAAQGLSTWNLLAPPQLTPHNAEPGALAKFGAGMIVPESPALAALTLLAPGIGKLGEGVSTSIPILKGIEKSIANSGVIGKAVKGGALRTGINTGVGATTSALTGESPVKGGIEGLVSGVAGEGLRTAKVIKNRDTIPRTTEGLARSEERFGPQWVQAVTHDLPALAPHVRSYDDLQSLIGNKVSGQIGREIYQPFRHALDVMMPNTRFTFPYLRPGRFGRLSINDPTISEILPNIDVKILQRAGQLSPNEALTVIQQLKDAAFNPAKDGAIRDAAKKFATQMEQDFTAVLNRTHPQLGNYYDSVKKQYSQLKGLQYALRKNRAKLFPGAGNSVGIDPAAWRETLRDAFEQVPDHLFPRLHNAVSFGGLHLGAGATYEPAQGVVRTSTESPSRLARFFATVFRPSGHISIPSATPPRPLSPYLRSLYPSIISGTENVVNKQGD